MSFNIVKLTGGPIQLTNVVGGLVPKGAYNAGTDYAVGDSVDYNGSSYVMHTDSCCWHSTKLIQPLASFSQ